jgi:mannose-6-phosphate isomerase-like protein (cupin superfamily)
MIFFEKDMPRNIQEAMRGGAGKVEVKAMVPADRLKGEAKMFNLMTFEPGAGIGEHDHVGNYEIYYILQGKAIAVDDGKDVEVGPGDIVYTADGASHSIRNIGDGPMVMLATIVFENKAQ